MVCNGKTNRPKKVYSALLWILFAFTLVDNCKDIYLGISRVLRVLALHEFCNSSLFSSIHVNSQHSSHPTRHIWISNALLVDQWRLFLTDLDILHLPTWELVVQFPDFVPNFEQYPTSGFIRELKQTTAATQATKTPPNKRLHENNCFARAL